MTQSSKQKTIYLVRHGQTKGNTKGVWLGSKSIDPLNEYGKKQSRYVAQYLKAKQIDCAKIFSSPTERALQTAEIVQKHLNLPIEKINSLTEINLGILEDKTRKEGIKLVPDEIKDWHSNLKYFKPPLGESAFEAAERFYETVELISKNSPKKNIVIIGHGVVIKLFLARVMKASMEKGEMEIKVPLTRHGSIAIFTFDGKYFKFKKVIENKYPDSRRVTEFG